jgi:recombinational DNA repair protein RecT
MSTETRELSKAEKDQKIAGQAAKSFRNMVTNIAGSLLSDWVGESRAAEAVGRVSSALASAAACAKNPSDFYQCTPQSIGAVIAISALTGIMPSVGANALAYAIPRRPRRGETPQLQYQLSHRGIAALARRAGQSLIAIPIGHGDKISVDDGGEVVVESRDIDNPPMTLDDLRGVIVLVRQLDTGIRLCCAWVPKVVILERRDGSDAYAYAEREAWAKESDPWHKWPIEMAMKTAMHYAVARGWCVIDDTESVRALSAESESVQVVDGSARPGKFGSADLIAKLEQQQTVEPAEPEAPASEQETPPTPQAARSPKQALEEGWKPSLQAATTISECDAVMESAKLEADNPVWPSDFARDALDILAGLVAERKNQIRAGRGEKSNQT